MKFLLLVLLTIPAVFGQSIQNRVNTFDNPAEYDVEYDKFRKVTTVRFDDVIESTKKNYSQMRIRVFAAAYIEDNGKVDYRLFFIETATPRRNVYNNDVLSLLLDNKLINIRERNSGDLSDFPLSRKIIEQIVQAKIVEIQLGVFEGPLHERILIKLRNLASLTKSQHPHPR